MRKHSLSRWGGGAAAAVVALSILTPGAAHAASDDVVPEIVDWWAICSPTDPAVQAYVEIDSASGGSGSTALEVTLTPSGSSTPLSITDTVAYPDGYVYTFPASAGYGNYTISLPEYPDAQVATVNLPGDCFSPFTDVPVDYQFIDPIMWMWLTNISTGWELSDGTAQYRPWGNVTRDAMAAFLYRAAGEPEYIAPSVSPFADVKTTQPFYKEIAWLADNGITTGWDISGGRKQFRPYQPITREAMAAFLYRFAGSPWEDMHMFAEFRDVSTRNPFTKEIAWLAYNEISTGWADGTFRPKANITRDAMAAFLYRFALAYS